ncbi:helicase-associated domain-containing protein [Microbacterium hydrocarbonoxydans]|uniref:helicase-associated domain-containing protein n=1 Tax=Microbacterium hydrocarbonoxydans TaxID=273678 RepID=UPI00203AAB93|nr:helicase-associated domain-containing protein [Microbacterium hydrocarbonoxydans]MCM3780079.1 helicase-associated domain-containing protein [Microbacterium hydrocarbonoxydans]
MSTHARPLAEHLAALSDADLSELFSERDVRPDVGWQDFFDAAEALLEPASLARVLPRLTLGEARTLQRMAAGERADNSDDRRTLERLALVRPDGELPPPVATAVSDRPALAPSSSHHQGQADDRAAAHAAERAFTTVATIADLLLAAKDRSFALLAGGTLSAGERRHLADSGVATESVDHLLAIASSAGLVAVGDRRLHATDIADQWLRSSVSERWSELARGFRDALPRGIRSGRGGWIPLADWPQAHPWDSAWPERSAALTEQARLLGLVADDGTEPAWAAPLRDGRDPDPASLTALLPAEVDRIFLQNDLSAISPGPLAPALDVRLRTVAARESAAQASTYRFTPESVARALVAGESEESLVRFLETVSLTGIPQPLRYLIAQTAQRHGLVRVSTDAETGRTRIESADPHLVDAIAVDQTLRPLSLTKHVGSLTTRVGRDTVYWALTDARYPATLVDEDGTVLTGERHAPVTTPEAGSNDYTSLIAALRSHQGPDADAAWLDRELEAAVRAKAVLRVTVGMPDGSTRELLLEATGLGGGRLRGRDKAADVERTLPVSSIRAATVIAQ